MADSLEATVARLEAAQQQNRRFVADVAHELRTPLDGAGRRGLAASSPAWPTCRRTPVAPAELLVGDVRRLRTLVDDLMEISRFDAGGGAAAPWSPWTSAAW